MNSQQLLKQMTTFVSLSERASNPEDKARFDNLVNVYRKQYNDKLDEEKKEYIEELAERQAKFEARIIEKMGDMDAWLDWANSMYSIEEENNMLVVRSRAKDWDKSWSFDHRIECLEKIEQLIGYKIYDHFLRA